MDKDKKNRSGSQSNEGGVDERRVDARQQEQPGAPSKSNRQTGDHEKDDSNHGPDKNTTKKQQNAV